VEKMGLTVIKQTKYPQTVARNIRFSSEELHRTFLLRHLREDGYGLICAEGEEYVCPLADKTKGFYATEDQLYSYCTNTLLYHNTSDNPKRYPEISLPVKIFTYFNAEGNAEKYVLSQDHISHITDTGVMYRYGKNKGGPCATIFKERIFSARDNYVFFTAPLAAKDWKETRYGGGQIELPSLDGKFIGVGSLHDQLYFFREHGIMHLRVLGDELNFKATPLNYGAGNIYPSTVAECGDRILFFTEGWLYEFNGSRCERQENSLFEQIEGQPRGAVAYQGKYYALCTHRTFGDCLYCFESRTGKGHFVFTEAVYLASGWGVFCAGTTNSYRLTERGLPHAGEMQIAGELSNFGLGESDKSFDGITIEGEGEFEVTGRTEYGVPYTVSGAAGEKLRFPMSLRGKKLALDVKCADENVRIKALTVHLTEVKNDD
ncbi:MAG: hypothetical protein K2N74_02600, partial [Clostridiales bacterium]|nr:hypothetical protein [Clostridiales bacterium]